MVMRSEDKSFELRQFMKGGDGSVAMRTFKPIPSLPEHYRVFGEMHINPGCSCGRHTHTGESEIYYILEGEGVLDDNGVERVVKAGDIGICYDGEFHAIANKTNSLLKVLAIVITNK